MYVGGNLTIQGQLKSFFHPCFTAFVFTENRQVLEEHVWLRCMLSSLSLSDSLEPSLWAI